MVRRPSTKEVLTVDGYVLKRADRGGRSRYWPANGRPPSTRSSLHASFFIACSGLTQGPPDSLKPGGAGDGEFQAQLGGGFYGQLDGPAPIRGHVGDAGLDARGCMEGGVEELYAAEAYAVHPLEVGTDAFFGDVAVHPVPPDVRTGGRRRIFEACPPGRLADDGRRQRVLVVATSTLLPSAIVQAQTPDALAAGFQDPPASARPRTWWHWMDGNITQEGIRQDLEWMRRVGLGGVQMFDAAFPTPHRVNPRITYMTSEWRGAVKLAVQTAADLDLEFSVAGAPG